MKYLSAAHWARWAGLCPSTGQTVNSLGLWGRWVQWEEESLLKVGPKGGKK